LKQSQKKDLIKRAIAQGDGVLRLLPAWVPRSFMLPGGRLKLARQDLYAFGKERGGIDERWIASTTKADNGPATTEDEGLSYILIETSAGYEKVLLKDAVEILGGELIGDELMEREGGWTVLCKLYDNIGAIPHHFHLTDEQAALVGQLGKPEAYYFPEQLNSIHHNTPYTYFGLNPEVTKDDVIRCLERWDEGDNGILELSRAYKIEPGMCWSLPAGILHAPGSLVTYEIQRASDVMSVFQSLLDGRSVEWDLVIKDVPKEHQDDLDYIVGMLDWEANINPDFKQDHLTEPLPVKEPAAMADEGYNEIWISYGTRYFSGKRLTVEPKREVIIKDHGAYGAYIIQGYGEINGLNISSPSMIRFGDITEDEVFVTYDAAQKGVRLKNNSATEPLVLLKHFGEKDNL